MNQPYFMDEETETASKVMVSPQKVREVPPTPGEVNVHRRHKGL